MSEGLKVAQTAYIVIIFKAVNNCDRNFSSAELQRRMEEIESSINRYLTDLDTADRQEPATAHARTERLQDKIAALKSQMQKLNEIEVRLNESPDKQISLTDPDARSMNTRGTGAKRLNIRFGQSNPGWDRHTS
jgi:transposase